MYYDSTGALLNSLESLEQLNKLIGKRRQAGYVRHENLREWVILGRFRFDSCGNVMKYVGDNIPAVMFPGIPLVMTRDGFHRFAQRNLKPGQKDWFSASMESGIPPENLVCPECGALWTIQTCHDTVISKETRVISLEEFAGTGTTLGMIKDLWRTSKQAFWFVQPDKPIRNDIYIDHTIVDSELGRQYGWEVNKFGWIEAEDHYQIKPGDEAEFNVWTYRHLLCHRLHQARVEHEYFLKIFTDAGYKKIQMTQVKNQYCSCEVCAPWYQVTANKLTFIIGWRKRVISISSDDPRIDFTKLFPNEDVTKDTHYIHAWGQEKCVEYLRTIKNSVDTSFSLSDYFQTIWVWIGNQIHKVVVWVKIRILKLRFPEEYKDN